MRIKVLITVKAYPALSKKYNETVCTAGITEDGKWIRVYPIPFRLLDYEKRFKKYQWIELDLIKNQSDFRKESYRPTDISLKDITLMDYIQSDKDSWIDRRKYVLKKVYSNLTELINEAKNPDILTSLAVFKPTKILDFVFEKVENEWKGEKLEDIKFKKLQLPLFESGEQFDIANFELVNKLPYKFSFIFLDDDNKKSKLMIEDWETGMLYWNSLNKHNRDEAKACNDVKNKYLIELAKTKDYYFFLGTTKRFHYTARNPFVIIGDFRPNFITQENLF